MAATPRAADIMDFPPSGCRVPSVSHLGPLETELHSLPYKCWVAGERRGVRGVRILCPENTLSSNRSLHPNSGPGGAGGCGAPLVRARPVANVPGKGFAQRRPGTWSARYTSTEGASASEAPFLPLNSTLPALLSLPEPQHSPAARRRPRPFFPPPDPPRLAPSSGSPPSPRRSAGLGPSPLIPGLPLAGPRARGPRGPLPALLPGDSGPFPGAARLLLSAPGSLPPASLPAHAPSVRRRLRLAAPSGSVFLKGKR